MTTKHIGILFFDGLPNLQRFDGFAVGETLVEQLQLALERAEKKRSLSYTRE